MELTYILKNEYKIFTVKDGTDALEKAEESVPDLILLDVLLPDMNGFEVFTELRKSENTKNIPVIFITGINKDDIESTGLAIGAVDYIRKPFDAAVVKLRVSNQVQIVNMRRELETAVAVAELANKTKAAFLSNVSHEIRTPVEDIIELMEKLMQDDAVSSEVKIQLNKIRACGTTLQEIINVIVHYSK
jgi:PleD family two-component response regulator